MGYSTLLEYDPFHHFISGLVYRSIQLVPFASEYHKISDFIIRYCLSLPVVILMHPLLFLLCSIEKWAKHWEAEWVNYETTKRRIDRFNEKTFGSKSLGQSSRTNAFKKIALLDQL